jgi:hypothetical protein
MQAWRSTLLLLTFWILVFLAGGWYVEGHLKDRQKKLKEQEAALQIELTSKQNLVAKAVFMQEKLGDLRNLWLYRSKAIPSTESPHQTYEYLDQILSRRRGTSMNFDFLQGASKDSAGVHSTTYKVTGEAKFEDIFSFIWYLEHLPPYLRINSLKIEKASLFKRGQTNRDWVSFETSLTAISADLPGFEEVEHDLNVEAPDIDYDLFRKPAKAVVKLPANTRRLPNVFEAELQAMTPSEAYIIDQNGDLKVLTLGDEVYLGYVIDIVPDANRVDFYLNQLSPPRKISLYIKRK